MSGKRLRPTNNSYLSPFVTFGEKVGAGQDNFVRDLPASNGRLVVKISQQKGDTVPTSAEVFASALYKKKKYEILKTFLGDFIPDSFFLVGNKTDGRREPVTVNKSYTIQERVPNVRLRELTDGQREDPRLLKQMYVLLLKLQNMYTALNTVNRVTGDDALDGKLDLGGISKFARDNLGKSSFDAAQVVNSFQDSPNLLVDPDSMRLYCVDFDDGVWSPEKEAAKGVLEHLANLPDSQRIIQLKPEFLNSDEAMYSPPFQE